MKERRRWARYPVSWPVQLSIGDREAVLSRAVDVSLHGLRVAVDRRPRATRLRRGEPCRIEVRLSDMEVSFVRIGEVRHVGSYGVGLQISEPLPRVLLDRVSGSAEAGSRSVANRSRVDHSASTRG